jgi:hypothetical protein
MSSPSPWRPRLVQEGKPLYGNDNDHPMMEEAEQQADYASSRSRHRQQLDDVQHKSGAPSSLAKAAGGLIPVKRRRHISTTLVVDKHSNSVDETSVSDDDAMACSPLRKAAHSPPRKASPLKTRLVIGGEPQHHHQDSHLRATYPQHQQYQEYETVERMEGVEHFGPKGPLVVMDGANVAYAYADALLGFNQGSREPDARGIQVALKYFLSIDVRVLVVIPAPWFRAKPRAGDESQGNAMMVTPQLEVLKDLKARGLLVAAPPRDDDDAYALTIARREDIRSHNRGGRGGFVLSCDMFRDAVNRDVTGELREWLTKGSGNGPGRISFAFCDMGGTDDYGDPEMDFVPNPRHDLIAWVEREHHRKASTNGN